MNRRKRELNHSNVRLWPNALLTTDNRRQTGGTDIDIVEPGRNRKHTRCLGTRNFFICPLFSSLLRKTGKDYRGFEEKNLPGIPRDTVFRIHAKSQMQIRGTPSNVRLAAGGLG